MRRLARAFHLTADELAAIPADQARRLAAEVEEQRQFYLAMGDDLEEGDEAAA